MLILADSDGRSPTITIADSPSSGRNSTSRPTHFQSLYPLLLAQLEQSRPALAGFQSVATAIH